MKQIHNCINIKNNYNQREFFFSLTKIFNFAISYKTWYNKVKDFSFIDATS